MYTCVFEDGSTEQIEDWQFRAANCAPFSSSGSAFQYSFPGYDDPNTESVETPPLIGPIGDPETSPPYTLPIEIFTQTVPVLVSRPEPVEMPIPTTLSYPEYPDTEAASMTPWIIGALVVGLLFGGGRAYKRRKRGTTSMP